MCFYVYYFSFEWIGDLVGFYFSCRENARIFDLSLAFFIGEVSPKTESLLFNNQTLLTIFYEQCSVFSL
jgi:hypothetical protein